MGIVTLLAGMAIFFGAHSVSIFAPAWRDRMAAGLGEAAWKGLYSVLAIVGFVLMVRGYSQAKIDPKIVYEPAYWLRHLAAIVMVPVFPLLLATYFPGRIKAAAQHPMLAATKLWATAHLLANGMLPDLLLFGGFLVWAVADRISLKHRPVRRTRVPRERRFNDLIAVVGGFALYVWFIAWAHVRLFGVSPVTG